jgi:hypothetical protein
MTTTPAGMRGSWPGIHTRWCGAAWHLTLVQLSCELPASAVPLACLRARASRARLHAQLAAHLAWNVGAESALVPAACARVVSLKDDAALVSTEHAGARRAPAGAGGRKCQARRETANRAARPPALANWALRARQQQLRNCRAARPPNRHAPRAGPR